MSAVPMRSDATETDPQDARLALSAFMDDEADMPAFLMDSVEARRDWDTYHLIGDVLRSEALALPVSARFSQRLDAALSAEPTVLAPRRRPLQRFVHRYAMPGAALAVVVVAVTWIAQPYIAPSNVLQASVPTSRSTLASASLPVNEDLVDYVDAHRHMTGMGVASHPGMEARLP